MMLGNLHAFALACGDTPKSADFRQFAQLAAILSATIRLSRLLETLQLKPLPIAKTSAKRRFTLNFMAFFAVAALAKALADRRTHGVTLGCKQHESKNERQKKASDLQIFVCRMYTPRSCGTSDLRLREFGGEFTCPVSLFRRHLGA